MIIFSYTQKDIFKGAQLIASHKMKTLLAKAPEAIDDIVIDATDDEEILIDYFKEGAGEIIGKMSGYTKNLYEIDPVTLTYVLDPATGLPILLDAITFVPASVSPVVDASVVFRLNTPTTFKETILVSLDQQIEKALKYFILYHYYKNKGHDFETFFDDYSQSISKILFYLCQRTATITRSYKMF